MNGSIKLEMNDYLPLRDVVFETLRSAILQGKLQPGERLMEIHLADQLGVSRTPVREALRKLELEGLVMMIPRRGAVVAEIARTDLEDALEVRTALEELAVRKACVKMTPQQQTLLLEYKHKFELSLPDSDIVECANIDAAFHQIIYDAAGNRRLISILGKLGGQLYRYRLENLKDKSLYDELLVEHDELCAALLERDTDRAARAIRQHILQQKETIIHMLYPNG